MPAVILGLLFLLSVVGGAFAYVEWPREPIPGGEYVEAVVGGPRYLNPLLARPATVDADVVRLVFRGLTRVEGSAVVPDLAARWDVSDDGTRYRFFLDPTAAWHDGRPVTAEDVLFTVTLLQSPDFPGDPRLAEGWSGIDVQRVEDGSVRFILPRQDVSFPERASLGLLPAHVLSNVPIGQFLGHEFNRLPVGTGSYRVIAADLSEIVLAAVRAESYRRPYLARIRFRFYADEAAARAASARGEARTLVGTSSGAQTELRELRANDAYAVHSAPDHGRTLMLVFNARAAPFDDGRVRRALAAFADRRRLAEAIGGAPADGPIPVSSWAYQAASNAPTDGAAELRAAGWQKVGDGWQMDGQSLKVVIVTDDGARHVRAAEEVARQWSAAGIPTDVQTVGWTGLLSDIVVPGRFQVALVEQHWPNSDPDLSAFWHSSGGLNFGRWQDESADALLERARATGDQMARRDLYGKFQELFASEMPGVPLAHPVVHVAIDRRIKDARLATIRDLPDRFATLADWYVLTRRVPLRL